MVKTGLYLQLTGQIHWGYSSHFRKTIARAFGVFNRQRHPGVPDLSRQLHLSIVLSSTFQTRHKVSVISNNQEKKRATTRKGLITQFNTSCSHYLDLSMNRFSVLRI